MNVRRDRLSRRLRLLIFVGLLSSSSCNGLRVYVSDKTPPSFTFDVGTLAECCTDLAIFAVFEEDSDRQLWRIVAKTIVTRNQTDALTIQYGQVPDQFVQEIPESGAPPQLVPGKPYVAVAGAPSYVPWARVRFIIKDNKIVKLPAEH